MEVAHVVYVLRDPQTNRVRYVGVTKNPKQRRGYHKTRKPHPHSDVDRWTDLLTKNGERPVFEVVAKFSGPRVSTPNGKAFTASKLALRCEAMLIELFRNNGCQLLNADMEEVRNRAKCRKPINQEFVAALVASRNQSA